MTQFEYKLLDKISSENPTYWGVIRNVDTNRYFGTEEKVELQGAFLYVYLDAGAFSHGDNTLEPTYRFRYGDQDILLYKLEDSENHN